MKIEKQFKKLVIFIMLALAMSIFLSMGVMAAGKPVITTKQFTQYDRFKKLEFKNIPDNATLVSAISSNKKVLKLRKGVDDVYVSPEKPGKSKVTVTYEINGKKKKLEQVITVKRYPNPVKKIMVNGKRVKSTGDMCRIETLKNRKGKAKVKITLKPGWVIVKEESRVEMGHNGEIVAIKRFKNGMTVTKKNKNDAFYMELILKNRKQTVNFDIDIL